ncbi:TIR domain-containing protein [Mesorhizobium muleiense]|uniref:TIR domain-containing protein n=1 Tax=Mesorhizobium muleiense TaxID=1004279 RepID=UPI001F3D6C0E|nr:TIR domain-containing protein [Mesorhizobium muleiense]MCF6108425.1 TIR domain-containing protein [Mesorhizobium muleiense]
MSYAHSDRFKVDQIAAALRTAGGNIWLDAWELAPGDTIIERVERAVQASDVFLVFLSPASIESRWVHTELGQVLTREMNDRAITVVPILIETCEIPPPLAGRFYVDLRDNWAMGVDRILHQIARAPDVDLLQLDPEAFEHLARDVLVALDFSVMDTPKPGRDAGVDFTATQTGSDPSNPTKAVTWMVQVKAYRQQRVSVDTVQQLLGALSSAPAGTKGLLVTNGRLTSVAREFLSDALSEAKPEIRVIDGSELKNLLLRHPNLVSRYFPSGARS